MNLNELAKEIYDIACEKGWHNEPVAFGDALSNIHGEVSEAWEEYRNGNQLNYTYYSGNCPDDCFYCEGNSCDLHGGRKKPEGVPSEFADIIIRVLDNCHMYGIDIEKAVNEKIEYNKTRPYKHGGKII